MFKTINHFSFKFKKLFVLDENKAYECLNHCVVKNLDSQTDAYFKHFSYQMYFDLFECLLLFKNKKELDKYQQLVGNKLKKAYTNKLNNEQRYKSDKETNQDILILLKDRINYLKDKVNYPPCFEWKMNACIPEYKDLEDFLKSDLEKTTLYGFNGKNFCNNNLIFVLA